MDIVQERKEKLLQSIRCSILYMVIYCVLVLLTIHFVSDRILAGVGIVGGIYIFINAFFIKYKRERLFVNGLISAIIVLCLGVLVGESIDLEGIIALGAAISIMDILSFTKYGKHTVNAKAMSNTHFMSKLVVYGKGKGTVLIPTKGVGDYFYYALWVAGVWNLSTGFTAYIMATVMIFIGTAIDYLIIAHLYKKDNYKGFPATVIPFICVAIWYGVLYFG